MTDRYDTGQTWETNLHNAPSTAVSELPPEKPLAGDWQWCGVSVNSPLGISAGPLLDSRWLLHYATLGFDILVYKTVRSSSRDCYPLPNLVPVDVRQLSESGTTVSAHNVMNGSWAVSFGMPSQAPDVWRKDVEQARRQLPDGKALVVSVVGTQDTSIADPSDSLEHLASDFARCAKWAVDAGAHGVEANFSCPNVSTADGQLYQQPESAGFAAARIREQIGRVPLVLKVGHVATEEQAEQLLRAVASSADGLAMTNSISARVRSQSGELMFDGHARGICGLATLDAGVCQLEMFRNMMTRTGLSLNLIGVGGIAHVDHVRRYLDAGADSVAMATAAMIDPHIGMRIRSSW